MPHALSHVILPATLLIMIAVSGRIIVASQSSMDEALEEVTQANAAARKKVVVILNSIILDPLSLSANCSNLQVATLNSSLSREVAADTIKDAYVVIEAIGKGPRIEDSQLSSDVPPHVGCEAAIAQASNPP